MTISLASSNTGVATVPATLTIPSGQAVLPFPVTGTGTGVSTISATLPSDLGGGTSTCISTVVNPTISLTPANPVVPVGDSLFVRVTVSPSHPSPVTISLSSSNPSAFTLSTSSLTIGADMDSDKFEIKAVGPGTSTITARLSLALGGGAAIANARTSSSLGAPLVVVSLPPRGMAQLAGQGGGTDAFTLTNFGSASAFITLVKSGDFFTISGESLTLDPGSSETIFIAGLPQNAGAYSGTVIASGSGADVRVRLLSVALPTGTVEPRASQSRAEINAPAGQSASASVQFTNSGNSPMNAMAVSDVPWMIPQSGVITIGAGETASVSYTVDSSKRPDADSPVGAVTGTLSLVFVRGSSTPTVSENAPGTSRVSVTLVYVVKPGTSQATPPPLSSAEIALFVPGLANRANATGDFLLSNKNASATLSDLKLYLVAPGAPSQLAALPTLPGGSSALFPGLLKNVFAASAQSGTAQVRTADVSKISVAGIQTDVSSPSGTFSTALPVLRSDRGVGSGDTVVLAGVLKEGDVQTNVYVQEVSGAPTTVKIDSLNTNGAVIASRSAQPVDGFALLEVLDATPAQAVSARITNLGNGRIGAFALVTNTANGDAWMVTDPGVDAPSGGTLIIPLFSAGNGADTTVFATNRSSSAITATMEVLGASKRRAVARASTGNATTPVSQATTLNLAGQQSFTTVVTSTSTGYIRFTASPGVLSAVARTVRSSPASGSGLPAIAASSALRIGESKRFTGVDDASPATRAARSPATFHSNLMLIETANESAVVRITVRYTFAAGTTVSARGVNTRDYSIVASQFVMISDVIANVIGAQRTRFGDLRNIDVDVEVVSGSGGIIAVLQSIDSASEDSLVRTE